MSRLLVVFLGSLLLVACGTPDEGAYPRLGDAPPAPQTTLNPERTAEITRELEQARDEAIDFAAQGRRSSAGPAVPPPAAEDELESESADEDAQELPAE